MFAPSEGFREGFRIEGRMALGKKQNSAQAEISENE